jgi:hypothetical protein
VQPVAGNEDRTLPLTLSTLAEVMNAAGFFIPLADGVTAREHELALEFRFLDFNLSKYKMEREPGDDAWSFVLSEPLDAEQALQLIQIRLPVSLCACIFPSVSLCMNVSQCHFVHASSSESLSRCAFLV